MADGAALLDLDEPAEVDQGGLDARVGITQGGALNGVLQELAGKGRLGGEARVATKRRLLVTRLKVGRGCGGGDTATPRAGGVDLQPGLFSRSEVAGGHVLEEGFYVAEAGLDLIYLSLTVGDNYVNLDRLTEGLAMAGQDGKA